MAQEVSSNILPCFDGKWHVSMTQNKDTSDEENDKNTIVMLDP